jgi:L-ascorbate metabolism protein UlaG (beta-lactamase superfamily)
MQVNGIEVTSLGHSTFLLRTPEGKQILIDPWTKSNPFCPEAFHDIKPDTILVTHGHNDHTGDLLEVAKESGAQVVCIYEIAMFLGARGIENVVGMNKGGTASIESSNISVTMTDAHHSSAFFEDDGKVIHYLGEPAGFVITFSNDTRLYIAGDTCLFGDMKWIGTLWKPEIAILPIGDFFTMDPLQAAHAAGLLGVNKVIPCHWGTFPMLTGTPDQLKGHLEALGLQVEVLTLAPGE